jgi:hypothetical protein
MRHSSRNADSRSNHFGALQNSQLDRRTFGRFK